MAFSWIDDDADPMLSFNGAHSSASGVQLQQNAEAVSDQRAPKIGVLYPYEAPASALVKAGELPRLCSVFPVAWGPYFVYLSPNESYKELNVRLRINRVVWSVGVDNPDAPSEQDAIRVGVSVGDARGNMQTRLPPALLSDAWTLLQTTGAAQTQSFTVRAPQIDVGDQDRQLNGWATVWLWTWSVINETPEDSGTFLSTGDPSVAAATGLALAVETNTIERAVEFSPRFAEAQNPSGPGSPVFQIGFYRRGEDAGPGAGNDFIYTIPPYRDTSDDIYTEGGDVHIYTMGVLELAGVEIEAVPNDFGPVKEGFYTGEGVRWQTHQTLAQRIKSLVNNRVPNWLCQPALVRDDPSNLNLNRRQWRLFSDDLGGNTTSALIPKVADMSSPSSTATLASCMVANPPPGADANGFKACVALYGLGSIVTHVDFGVRLRARQLDGTQIDSGSTSAYEVALQPPWLNRIYIPLNHTLHRSVQFIDWQFRGALMPRTPLVARLIDDALFDDFELVHYLECEIDEDNLTYPCVLQIEGFINEDSFEWDVDRNEFAILGAGIASRELT